MIIRLGYVAIALNLPKVTSSSNLTYTRYEKITLEEERINKLKEVTLSNLEDLYKILQYNIKNQVHFYRVTSKLVPLATHPNVENWDYRKYFKGDFERIGRMIKDHNMRIDTHPDQFNVINSIHEKVVLDTQRNLNFHANLFEDINYPEGKMILHVGSSQGGKEIAMNRFIDNLKKFPKKIINRLILENDDKVFTAKEVLNLCKALNLPMVLDVHHHVCNDGEDDLKEIIEEIFKTWDKEKLTPKIHFSSPRNGEKDRKHADYINPYDFIDFIEQYKEIGRDFDVMLEAKMKDVAVYQLIKDIKDIKKEWRWIDNTTLEV